MPTTAIFIAESSARRNRSRSHCNGKRSREYSFGRDACHARSLGLRDHRGRDRVSASARGGSAVRSARWRGGREFKRGIRGKTSCRRRPRPLSAALAGKARQRARSDFRTGSGRTAPGRAPGSSPATSCATRRAVTGASETPFIACPVATMTLPARPTRPSPAARRAGTAAVPPRSRARAGRRGPEPAVNITDEPDCVDPPLRSEVEPGELHVPDSRSRSGRGVAIEQYEKRRGDRFAGAVFAVSLLFGIGLTAQAQYPNQNDRYRRDDRYDRNRDQRRNNNGRNNGRNRFGDDYPDWGGTFDLRQTALNAGANEGIKAGRDDRRKNRRSEFRDENAYQKATKDYSSRLGDRGLYQSYFRIAFEHAYADGYAGY